MCSGPKINILINTYTVCVCAYRTVAHVYIASFEFEFTLYFGLLQHNGACLILRSHFHSKTCSVAQSVIASPSSVPWLARAIIQVIANMFLGFQDNDATLLKEKPDMAYYCNICNNI